MGFRDLQRYPAMKARYDKYKEWLEATPLQRQQKYAAITDETKRAKPDRERGYISPFGTAGNTKVYIPVRLLSEQQSGQGGGVANTIRTLLSSYTTTETEFGGLTSPILIEAKKFKAAKLTLTSATSFTKKASRITGAQYNKPDVDSISSPFGQNTGGQAYDEVVTAIRGASGLATFLNAANARNRVRFTPEG